jgi:glycosyltransferase involved in cell wall biosynthesis
MWACHISGMQADAPIDVVCFNGSSSPLRIAVVTETYPPDINGVAYTLSKTVEGLKARGHALWLIRPRQNKDAVISGPSLADETLVRGMPIPFYKHLKMGFPAKRALTRLWTLHRPDVVHIATEGPLGWSALQAAKKLKLPVSSDFRTNFHAYSDHYGIGWLRGAIMNYMRKFHNAALATMVPTPGLASELSAVGFERLHVVPRGVDTDLFNPVRRSPALRAEWGASQDCLVLLCVGRLAAEKNLSLVVSTFERMAGVQPQTKLVLVGDGPLKQGLQKKLPQVVFAGFRTGDDLAQHYASADMFLFPSLTETFGNVTLEAMSSGLPVVAYRHAAAAELIRTGENGQLIEPGAEDDFQRAAVQLAEMHTLRAKMGQEARITALGQAWPLIFQKTEKIFRQVIQDHAPQLG